MRLLLVHQPQSTVLGGSETYLLTVAPYLARLGHEVEMVAPAAGPVAAIGERLGVSVSTEYEDISIEPEAVVTGDAESAYEAAARFPSAVRVFVVHSSIYEPQRPPQEPGVLTAVIALNEGMRQQAEALAVAPRVVRMRQPVDLERFTDRGGRGERPRRVLLLGNHWGGPGHRNFDAVASACAGLGLELEHVGAGGSVSLAPELAIADADIVCGIGRCILEAMGAARAAYVFGHFGGDGWVTPASYERMEAIGFAGGAKAVTIDAETVRRDLGGFDPDMGQLNRQLAVAHHDAHRHAAGLVKLVRALRAEPVDDPAALPELARMARVIRREHERVAVAEADARRLRSENASLRALEAAARDERDRLAQHLDAVVRGRRYRVAQAIGRPLDLLRSRRRTPRE